MTQVFQRRRALHGNTGEHNAFRSIHSSHFACRMMSVYIRDVDGCRGSSWGDSLCIHSTSIFTLYVLYVCVIYRQQLYIFVWQYVQFGAVFNVTPTSGITAVDKYGTFPALQQEQEQHSACVSRSPAYLQETFIMKRHGWKKGSYTNFSVFLKFLKEYYCMCDKSSIKHFVPPVEAACGLINYLQWCHSVAKLHCG